MALTIPVAHDFICPWCWVGLFQAKRLQSEFGAQIEWRGYELFPDELAWPDYPAAKPKPGNRPDTPSRFDLMLAADASYRSKSFTNSPVDTSDELSLTQRQPEHVIYNANIVFNTADDHWRFALEGRNLTNRRVLTNTFDLDLGLNPAGHSTFVMGSYNDPKTWALSAAYKY